MKHIKQYFKSWNIFEIIFLALGWVLPVFFGVLHQSSVLEIISTTFSLTAALLLAKGKIEGYFLAFIACVVYIIVCYQTKVYGEAIVCLVVSCPIFLFGIYSWVKNKRFDKLKGQVVTINKIKAKELAILILSQMIMGVGYYFILKIFETPYLLVSTISITAQITAVYLLARRSQFGTGPYVFADIAQITLWSLIVAAGNISSVAVLIMPCMYLIEDMHGFFEWRQLKKSQTSADEVSPVFPEKADSETAPFKEVLPE